MSTEKSEPTQQNFADDALDAEAGEDAEAIRAPGVKAVARPAAAPQAVAQANGDTRKA